ncbi:hypothetical protein [Bifidobacterium psychraerophilum]|uniref:Uncharacterized protein n=1 Tax=Bifidobacterium psychraerophilum TaxID=218140 RepID=A0A087CCP8_9BIFI|nr:hypothetical protein [Bifidobacterium psychraerophilum]KFI81048.1 hypothetical protein BPSY_1456 [Bifidobacterium psychraerophilum]PKA95393.1 hypothetical protein A9A89_1658 [Bifidobacterium psychraerophilum DSM 22366]
MEAAHGRWLGSRFPEGSFFIDPEEVASSDAESPYGRRCRNLIQQWCCADAVAHQDELKALRREVMYLDKLVTDAICALRAAKLRAQADDIQLKFGVPIDEARGS